MHVLYESCGPCAIRAEFPFLPLLSQVIVKLRGEVSAYLEVPYTIYEKIEASLRKGICFSSPTSGPTTFDRYRDSSRLKHTMEGAKKRKRYE